MCQPVPFRKKKKKEQELPVQYIVQLSPSLLAHSSWITQLPIKFLSKYFFFWNVQVDTIKLSIINTTGVAWSEVAVNWIFERNEKTLNTPLEIEVKSGKGYWAHHSRVSTVYLFLKSILIKGPLHTLPYKVCPNHCIYTYFCLKSDKHPFIHQISPRKLFF